MRSNLALGALAWALAAAHAQAQAPAGPHVRLETNLGAITIALDPAHAPKTAANFLAYVKRGHYDGAAVYRIEPGYLVQLGDLDAKGRYRKPGLPPIPLETADNRHVRGAVAMAHGDDPNSAQSTFYFDLADNANLNADPAAPANTTGYAVFGHVVDGMDVLDKIAALPRKPKSAGGYFPGQAPVEPVVVMKAAVSP